jgi:hypothetical protein
LPHFFFLAGDLLGQNGREISALVGATVPFKQFQSDAREQIGLAEIAVKSHQAMK